MTKRPGYPLAPAATVVAAVAMAVALLPAQSPPVPAPAFEVVSIKPNPVTEGTLHKTYSRKPAPFATGNRFAEKQTTVQDLVMEAYGMWDYQISGLPDWAQAPNGEHYAVEATIPGDKPTAADQLQSMVQSLLADRFHLRLHREMKELPVYVLTVGKNGSRLTELPGDPRPGAMIQGFINLLSNVVDRPIVDKTGLERGYDFAAVYALKWAQLGAEYRADPTHIAESLAAVMDEKLGLKLESRKEPVEVLVIDHAEKPSAN